MARALVLNFGVNVVCDGRPAARCGENASGAFDPSARLSGIEWRTPGNLDGTESGIQNVLDRGFSEGEDRVIKTVTVGAGAVKHGAFGIRRAY